jgi:hypothetical protein
MLPKTIRKDMATVEFSIPTEDFLLQLFGSPMLYLHGVRSQKTWKKIQKKIHYALNKAIENNVQSDAFHRASIKRYLDSMERDCNSKDNTDIQMILSLTGIVLELLGRVPNYSSRRALNRNDDYYLSGLRTLKYCQTPHQKMRTILEAAHYKPYCDYHKSDDLYDVYVTKYNGNSAGFLEWYKMQYPQVYCEIF